MTVIERLFETVWEEYKFYLDLCKEEHTAEDEKVARERFCALYQFIVKVGLEADYQEWKAYKHPEEETGAD